MTTHREPHQGCPARWEPMKSEQADRRAWRFSRASRASSGTGYSRNSRNDFEACSRSLRAAG
jgi:hypothetical protein